MSAWVKSLTLPKQVDFFRLGSNTIPAQLSECGFYSLSFPDRKWQKQFTGKLLPGAGIGGKHNTFLPPLPGDMVQKWQHVASYYGHGVMTSESMSSPTPTYLHLLALAIPAEPPLSDWWLGNPFVRA